MVNAIGNLLVVLDLIIIFVARGGEVGYLVGLITQRSQVRVLLTQPVKDRYSLIKAPDMFRRLQVKVLLPMRYKGLVINLTSLFYLKQKPLTITFDVSGIAQIQTLNLIPT